MGSLVAVIEFFVIVYLLRQLNKQLKKKTDEKKSEEEKETEEEKGEVIEGTIVGKQYASRGIVQEPVTLLEIAQDDGVVHRGAIGGHQISPEKNDRVLISLTREIGGTEGETKLIKGENGTTKVVAEKIEYFEIKSFKILREESKTEEPEPTLAPV